MRSVAGGLLVQDRDSGVLDEAALKVVTKRAPTAREMADLRMAWRVAKHVKSNAIVYVKDGATAGVGAGQMSRVDSARVAARKALDAAAAAGWAGAAHQRLGRRLGRIFSLRRRASLRDRGRRDRGHRARRIDARR